MMINETIPDQTIPTPQPALPRQPVVPTPPEKKSNVMLVLSVVVLGIVGVGILGVITLRFSSPPNQSDQAYKKADVTAVERNGTMKLLPSTGSLNVGKTLNVEIMVDGDDRSLDGVDLVLSYDPTLFTVTFAQSLVFPLYPKKINNTKTGQIQISGFTLEAVPTPISGSFVFGTLWVTGKRSGTGSLNIEFNKGRKNLSTIIENKTSETILGTVESGTYTVIQ